MGSSSGLLGLVGAVLLIVGTNFLGRAAKGRRLARRASDQEEPDHEETNLSLEETEHSNARASDQEESDHEETNLSLEETEHSNARADVSVPDIFLSHSGVQKTFVESLYRALQSANHTAFFDQHTLPKGRRFPDKIKESAKGCKVGVVVLSEEFFTSKWPMIELEILISHRGPKPCVLPLFYKLEPADLKSSEKLSKWKCKWKELGGEKCAEQWEQAVKDLRPINGEVYAQGTGTYTYIDKVVRRIGTLIPCHVPYDCSSVRGQSRLAQEIATKFEKVDASQACMVGLYGVGGLGKTTLCKVMVNYYSSHYSGRSFLIEFPSFGGNNSMVTLQCKKALEKLTDASYKHLLDTADGFDQVVHLMRDRVGCHDVFLAIDNVWESSLEDTKRVLQVGFSANSKILVTSRSEEVLKDLLRISMGPVTNVSVAPLPAPEREEAFQIFQGNFELCDLSSLVDRSKMDEVLGRCWFSGSYHPLALKAVAKYVRKVCMAMDLEEIKTQLSCVLEEIIYEDLSDVEKVIRLSYDILPDEKKHIFLDIVVFLRHKSYFYNGKTYAEVQEWIRFLYWKLTKNKTIRLINELFFDGLIQIKVGYRGTKEIELHDLYHDFALREIASSPRFFIKDFTERSVEKIEWEKVEMVILDDEEPGPCLFEKLQHCKCSKLKLLRAEQLQAKRGVWLNLMLSLCVLTLEQITEVPDIWKPSEHEGWSSSTDSEKENVAQSNMLQSLEQFPSLPSLDQESAMTNSGSGFTRGEGLVDASYVLHLNGLANLQKLELLSCSFVEEIAGLDTLLNLRRLELNDCKWLKSLDGLSGLVQLQVLRVEICKKLQNLPDMSSLTCLERLMLCDNAAIEEVGGLSHTLKDVRVDECWALERMPDMSCLTCLERLELFDNPVMEEVGDLSCTVKVVIVRNCLALKRMPDMSSLTCLEMLEMSKNKAMEEVGGLSCTLKDVCVAECWALKRMPDMSSLTCLERLELVENLAMEEVGGLSCTLKIVAIKNCWALKRVPDMSNLTCLERLELVENPAMEEVGGLSCTLKDVAVTNCSAVKRMPDMSSLTCLESLKLFDDEALEEVGGEYLSSTLKNLCIAGCRSLRSWPSLEKCLQLEALETDCAHYISSLQKLPNLYTCLRFLIIVGDSTMKEIGVGCFTNLESLAVRNFEALEEIEGLSALRVTDVVILECPSLKKLTVGCPSLKRLRVQHCKVLKVITGDSNALPSLEDLTIKDCDSLEKLGVISSTPLHNLSLQKCRSLQSSSIPKALLPQKEDGWYYTTLIDLEGTLVNW